MITGTHVATTTSPSSAVDERRLWQRHLALAAHGATPAGGVNRQALTPAEGKARRTLVDWARQLSLEPSSDCVGNLFLEMPGESDEAPVLSGSHIDTQPTGGRFDGAYGVLAALEALQAMRDLGLRPRRPLRVVAWMNEEGGRFAPGMMGSAVFTGRRELDAVLAVCDAEGVSVGEALCALREAEPDVPQCALGGEVAAFIEAHIEQGPVLERAALPVGVVTGIQGSRRFRVTVSGQEAHAGTTPRAERRDALSAAVAMIGELERHTASPRDVMCTVGMLRLQPNAPSVVPSLAYFSIDLRHPEPAVLNELGDGIEPLFQALRGPCEVRVEEIANSPSLMFPGALRARISATAKRLGIPSTQLYSLAGHDARELHYHCPSAMIFVPCKDGLSHNEAESAAPADLVAGARVLADLLWELAND